MATVYEGMFLLDNQVVREDWKRAKTLVTGMIEKHGGNVLTARRWDERRLAYPIKGKKRATYLITYYELPGDAMAATRRDFDLSEQVLRYLWLAVDGVPEEERALADAENADDFTVPEPPEDDAPEEEPEEASDDGDRDRRRGADGEASKPDAAADGDAPKEGAEAPAAEGGEKAGAAKPEGEEAPKPAEAQPAETKAESTQEGATEAPKED